MEGSSLADSLSFLFNEAVFLDGADLRVALDDLSSASAAVSTADAASDVAPSTIPPSGTTGNDGHLFPLKRLVIMVVGTPGEGPLPPVLEVECRSFNESSSSE